MDKKKYIPYILIGILFILVIIFLFNNRGLKNELNLSEQNIKALTDSVRISKNKIGDLEYSINTLVVDKKDLAKLNKELANELEKERGKVFELNQYILSIKPDIVYLPVEVIEYQTISEGIGIYGVSMDYDTIYSKNNYRHLQCLSKISIDSSYNILPLGGVIEKDEIGFDLITGLRELDGNIEIFARSNYPGLVITNMQGAIIDPDKNPILKKFTKPKKFGISVVAGIGTGISTINYQPNIYYGITIGLSYQIVRF